MISVMHPNKKSLTDIYISQLGMCTTQVLMFSLC
uniref:Uncharacterized protein n=1 Tax=Anguilla anguilla TaxID=7936 RepID=A0A0E9XTS4_ANGAN